MEIKPGDIYEDCTYHPVLCTEADEYDVAGISLIDGSYPRSCSLQYCGVRKLTLEEALKIKNSGPLDPEAKKQMEEDTIWDWKPWWDVTF